MEANEEAAARLRMTTAEVAEMLGLGRKATLERIKRAGIQPLPNCPANKPEYLRTDVMAALFSAGDTERPARAVAKQPGEIYSAADAVGIDWPAVHEAEADMLAIKRDEDRAAAIDAALLYVSKAQPG